MDTVLLTGITGFIGSHTAVQLLELGYHVIGTTRNLDKEDEIISVIKRHTDKVDNLKLIQMNLTDEEAKWNTAMKGVDYVMHIASPLPRVMPRNPDDVIIPAKEGVLNVLKAASKSNVKRVVLTSSMAAIAYGVEKHKTFTDLDWTDENNLKDTTTYVRSKAIAEKAAWNFMENYSGSLELTTVNPGLVLGPILDENDYGTSAALILKMIDGSLPALPKIGYSIVDVRSVADMHIKAMTTPEAAGERFLCANTFATMTEIAEILRQKYPDRKIPKFTLPDFFLRLVAIIDKETAPAVIELGSERKHDNSKAIEILKWEPIDDNQSILDTAESLIELGFVK